MLPHSDTETPLSLFPMDFHDNVKAEKDEAMRRFRRTGRNFRSFLILAVLSSATFLSPWISSAAADIFRRVFFLLHQPSFVFLLLNGIITVIFVSSARKSDRVELLEAYVKSAATEESPATNFTYAEETFEETKSEELVTFTEEETSLITVIESEKQEAELEIAIRETPEEEDSPPPVESEMAMVEQTEDPMDELSSEEFRKKIETFIAAKKKTLYRENMAECESNGTVESWRGVSRK